MKTIQLIATVIGLSIITGGVNSSFAMQVQVQTNTTFSCSSNAECKKKCAALGSDHTLKLNPGGSTFGTCIKRSQPLAGGNKIEPYPPPKAELDSLSVVTQNAPAIHKELNVLFSKSYIAKELGLEGAQINSISIGFKKDGDRDICASCLWGMVFLQNCVARQMFQTVMTRAGMVITSQLCYSPNRSLASFVVC